MRNAPARGRGARAWVVRGLLPLVCLPVPAVRGLLGLSGREPLVELFDQSLEAVVGPLPILPILRPSGVRQEQLRVGVHVTVTPLGGSIGKSSKSSWSA